jgi:hypothetical protein
MRSQVRRGNPATGPLSPPSLPSPPSHCCQDVALLLHGTGTAPARPCAVAFISSVCVCVCVFWRLVAALLDTTCAEGFEKLEKALNRTDVFLFFKRREGPAEAAPPAFNPATLQVRTCTPPPPRVCALPPPVRLPLSAQLSPPPLSRHMPVLWPPLTWLCATRPPCVPCVCLVWAGG